MTWQFRPTLKRPFHSLFLIGEGGGDQRDIMAHISQLLNLIKVCLSSESSPQSDSQESERGKRKYQGDLSENFHIWIYHL